MIEGLLSEALEHRFLQDDLADCFVVAIEIAKNDKVTVYIDADSTLSLERCRIVSRYLEKLIEENAWLGEKYILEVSSPGVDRPLKLPRQYVKNIGRRIRIIDKEGRMYEGKLIDVDVDSFVIEVKNKKKITWSYDGIIEAKILISFK